MIQRLREAVKRTSTAKDYENDPEEKIQGWTIINRQDAYVKDKAIGKRASEERERETTEQWDMSQSEGENHTVNTERDEIQSRNSG